MSNKLVVLGNESSVIYYNLNKQFSTVRKIFITPDFLLSAFESDVKSTLQSLSYCDLKSYKKTAQDILEGDVLDGSINNELSKQIQEKFPKISDSMMDIQLANYSFMNSVSNAKFNVTLRCESFSITKYYVEKNTILSAIRHLLKEYVGFEGNQFRAARFMNFQIELYESEEIYKRIILKKEGSSLILVSHFGFDITSPFDYNVSGEMYFSKGEDFFFFENNQSRAIIKDHAHLSESDIHKQNKILSDENLVLVNENTRNINDAVIDLYLTRKGNLKILNLSLLENSLNNATEDGFIINKSSKTYDKISIVGLRDNLDEDLPNPKYIIIRNSNEVKELLGDMQILSKVDGIIFNENFYCTFFDKIGQVLDIDVLFYKQKLSKALEVKVNISSLEIGQDVPKKGDVANPFSNIITETQKEKDEFLERLKNLDLSTPGGVRGGGNSDMMGVAQRIISSPNSSDNISTSSNASSNFRGSLSGSSGEKKGAIGLLADAVLGQGAKPVQEVHSPQPQPQVIEQRQQNSFGGFVESNITAKDLNPISEERVANVFSGFGEFSSSNSSSSIINEPVNNSSTIDISVYENVIATKIITSPGVSSEYYFVDSSNISEVSGGELFMLTTSREHLSNPSINYVLPSDMYTDSIKSHSFIINSVEDLLALPESYSSRSFVNIASIEPRLRRRFLKICISVIDAPVFVISESDDIDYLSDDINMVDGVFVRDVEDDSQLDVVKSKLLAMEKKFLIRN